MTPERDEATEKTLLVSIPAATYAADQAGNLNDMLGFRSATLLLHIGAGGIVFTGVNKIEFVLQHGNAADGSDLVNVTADDVILDGLATTPIANGIVRALTAAHAAADVQKVGYIAGKRYLKLTADFSGVHGTGTPISATLVEESANFEGAA